MAAESVGLLLDTHLLLWWATMPEQLPAAARIPLESADPPPFFSVVSLWEVAIKASGGCSTDKMIHEGCACICAAEILTG